MLPSNNDSIAALTQGHQETAGSFLEPEQLGQSLLKLSPIPSLPELPVSHSQSPIPACVRAVQLAAPLLLPKAHVL